MYVKGLPTEFKVMEWFYQYRFWQCVTDITLLTQGYGNLYSLKAFSDFDPFF